MSGDRLPNFLFARHPRVTITCDKPTCTKTCSSRRAGRRRCRPPSRWPLTRPRAHADVTCGSAKARLLSLLSEPPETRPPLAQRSGPTPWSMRDLLPGIGEESLPVSTGRLLDQPKDGGQLRQVLKILRRRHTRSAFLASRNSELNCQAHGCRKVTLRKSPCVGFMKRDQPLDSRLGRLA